MAYDGREQISERHRHRFEFNNTYREAFAENGMVFSGLSPDALLVEIVELRDHPYMVGCQFHPEFASRPTSPHPLFSGLISAAIERRKLAVSSETANGKVPSTPETAGENPTDS